MEKQTLVHRITCLQNTYCVKDGAKNRLFVEVALEREEVLKINKYYRNVIIEKVCKTQQFC